jgi:hypothetical protein
VTTELDGVNPDLTWTFRPLASQIDASTTRERITAVLAGFFGGLALLLAGLGLYGVTAYSVSRRRSEIGIRIALGARPAGVVRLVVSRVIFLVGIGVMVGTAASLWLSQFVAPLLRAPAERSSDSDRSGHRARGRRSRGGSAAGDARGEHRPGHHPSHLVTAASRRFFFASSRLRVVRLQGDRRSVDRRSTPGGCRPDFPVGHGAGEGPRAAPREARAENRALRRDLPPPAAIRVIRYARLEHRTSG